MSTVLPPGCAERYDAIRLIATGGFGAVYMARQRSLDRVVAIKVLNALDDADTVARFEQEARIAASLDHPGIVPALDAGVDGGVPWIAFEFVEGESLRERLAAGPLDPLSLAAAGSQVAAALAVAHVAGVVHRDIKPENVMVAQDRYRLTDFGVARWSRGGVRTGTGIILGTPPYVAPEMVLGQPASPASDLYALGTMLFELAAGRTPFSDPNPMLVLERHVRSTPPPVRSLAPDLPPAVATVIDRLLLREPGERGAGARSVHEELDSFLSAGARPVATAAVRVPRPKSHPAATLPVARAAPAEPSRVRHGRRQAAAALVVAVLVILAVSAPRSGEMPGRGPATSVAPPSTSSAPEAGRVLDGLLDGWRERERSIFAAEIVSFGPDDPRAGEDWVPRVEEAGRQVERNRKVLDELAARHETARGRGRVLRARIQALGFLEKYHGQRFHLYQNVIEYVRREAGRPDAPVTPIDFTTLVKEKGPYDITLCDDFTRSLAAVHEGLVTLAGEPSAAAPDTLGLFLDTYVMLRCWHVLVLLPPRCAEEQSQRGAQLRNRLGDLQGPLGARLRPLVRDLSDAASDGGREGLVAVKAALGEVAASAGLDPSGQEAFRRRCEEVLGR